MSYDRLSDCFAATVAEDLAYEALTEGRATSLREICRHLSSGEVCIAGGSESLAKHIDELISCNKIIAVDGATSLLLDNGVVPNVVVSDLDGRLEHILKASRDSQLVIHVHGDNYPQVIQFSKSVRPSHVIYTHQCPVGGTYSVYIPGFTDGERALALSILCRANKVILYGMRTWERVGYWSKPWLKSSSVPWPVKRRKLVIAEFFIRLFTLYGIKEGIQIIRR